MYRVVIADDEPMIRKGLRETIEWDNLGLEVSGEAANGRQALELVRSTCPHILITDIKMPEMDGIDLIREVKTLERGMKIIILSGFSDYAYLKEAIRLGVESYLLKPIDNDELVSNLADAVDRIEKEAAEETHFYQGSELLKTNTLNRLVSHGIRVEEFLEKADFLKMDVRADRFLCAVCDTQQQMPADFKPDDILAVTAIRNICADLAGGDAFTFVDTTNRVTMLFLLRDSSADTSAIKGALESMVRNVRQALGIKLWVGVGCVAKELEDVWQSYDTAKSSLDFGVFMVNGGVVWHRDVTGEKENCELGCTVDWEKAKACIRKGDKEGIDALIDAFFDEMSGGRPMSIHQARNIVMQLMVKIMSLFRSIYEGLQKPLPAFDYTELLSLRQLQEMKSWVFRFCEELFAAHSAVIGSGHATVGFALAYILEHYTEGINLKQVATQCNINPSYLGQLFKKETGRSFTDYVNELRINKAQDLLANASYKVYEIAAQVGFTDYHYFLKIFKKLTGVTPTVIKN